MTMLPRSHRPRDSRRRPVHVVARRHSVHFEPSPVLFSVLRQIGCKNMTDPGTRWIAVQLDYADEVMARLEARGYVIDLVEGVRP